ncbi:hypothetical protein DUF71 [Gottschalkia acidurici 9a]|uniref:Diphthamide synthase domain-containing protein n=1 Tax=Gottschalkia acidurici (strain ATCC 7906 / DSM 604 / BCRC 14475 / CIP 104303 / KCTC 5404 / NCIMB 10678 / 9a) TaxID=1128398 RepID=K0B2I7_GOTA9|nr:diphthine--ammonia ligase [Gottschalkia acidurici]AFS79150.1 hypothetical protein DUF71 [Gottschalkia acidurici 9a]
MRFFCSWSGGKDSCLALYESIVKGNTPDTLFTVFVGNGERSRAHGLKQNIIEAQAKSLNIPLEIGTADWGEYESVLIEFLKKMKRNGVEGGVFGDIDLQGHKDWIDKVCEIADITPMLPLWQRDRVELVNEFIDLGFETMIVSTKSSVMGKEYLGQILDKKLVNKLQERGIDPSGEGGEFHTLVIDGPIFKERIELNIGEISEKEKYYYLDVSLK